MCEGKFLVKTSVTTDNVIRQVTVENFRFGVRVIKKPEGRWICQDLNNSNGDTHAAFSLNAYNGSLRDNFSQISTNSKECSLDKRLLQEDNNTSTPSEKNFVATAPSISLEGPDFINRTCDRERSCQQLVKHEDNNNDRVTRSLENSHPHDSVLVGRTGQFSSHKSPSLDSILYRHLTTHDNKSIESSKCHRVKVPADDRRFNNNNRLRNSGELKNQYLSSILGPSPLLKLQLLNLYVAPLDGGHTFPELLPLSNVSRLRMLFDEDGTDKSGSGGTDSDRDPKRVREMEVDGAELSKRVKIEPEDEDNLVIDENVGFGEDLSINSEESNENEENPLLGIHLENANSVVGKRSSSDSSTEASVTSKISKITIVKKNGHDASISQVPKLTSNESSSKVYEECNSTSNNSVDSNSSVNEKVLRLEREIQGLASLLKTKEQEWNAILRLKKLKELEVEFLRRQKEVEEIFEEEALTQHEEYLRKLGDKINVEVGKIGPDEGDVGSNIEKTEKEIKDMEKKLKNSRVGSGNGKKENSKDLKQTDGHLENFKASLALQQLCERNRNSLAQANSPVQLTSNANIQNKVIGEGRQGTIVEVRSIIADYRSKNPEETGSNQEARRRSQKKGASCPQRSATNTGGTSIISQNQNVSFKDVLVNLAKLSQNDKTGVLTTLDNVTVAPRATTKTTNNVQSNSFSSQRGQLGTTLAKLLSSNSSSSNLPVGIVHPDDGNSVGSVKIEAVNHTSDSNLSLANLLASAKCRDDEIKTEDDDLVPICQGCNTNRAQFVCAGCGNQWYCCRECQIQAWEDHSEICSG